MSPAVQTVTNESSRSYVSLTKDVECSDQGGLDQGELYQVA